MFMATGISVIIQGLTSIKTENDIAIDKRRHTYEGEDEGWSHIPFNREDD